MKFLQQERKDCDLVADKQVGYDFAELHCKPNNECWDACQLMINKDADIVYGRNENAEAYNDYECVQQCKQSLSVLLPDIAFNGSCKQKICRLAEQLNLRAGVSRTEMAGPLCG